MIARSGSRARGAHLDRSTSTFPSTAAARLGRPRLTPATATSLAATIIGAAFAFLGCGDAALESQADQVCAALSEERFEDALAASREGASARGAGREIAECRCISQLSLGDRDGCTELLGPLLAAPEANDWVPHPVLTKLILRTWQAEGALDRAAELARRAAPAARDDLDLLQLEIMLRSTQEDETAVLSEIEARLTSDPGWLPQRLVLALAWHRRARYDHSLRVLGEVPPAIEHPLALPWYESRIQAQAGLDDLAGVQQTFARWRATGWDPVDLAARYALRLSVSQLVDPERHTIDLLRAAVATQDQLADRQLAWGVHRRLIQEYLGAGLPAEALAVYDEAIQVVSLEDITRAQIERAVRLASGAPEQEAAGATLRFHAPAGLGDGSLAISPGPEAAPDAGYTRHALTEGSAVEVPATLGKHPRRWILRDDDGAIRGSGSVWPESGATVEVRPALRPARPPHSHRLAAESAPPGFEIDRKPADGRRRIFAVLADCGDWRLTEYLRERGELPFHDHLFSQGFRAVLESRPAFTAAAMQALVWPSTDSGTSSLGWIHHLGLELAGLESIGRNPFEALSWVLPTRPNLFETLGRGSLVTANMLLAHGRIDAGRHAELVGPHGAHRALPSQNAYRALADAERARHPALLLDANTRKFSETIAAEMDVADTLARGGEVDFLFLRLESLDLLTHGYFGELDGAGQDDGAGPLLSAYRYIDDRLAALYRELDEDDWLVFLSDHGIRSSMEHEEDALFVVIGDEVPHGRAPGLPPLRGVPRSLAAMFGVETDWPRTAMAPWLVASEAPSDPARPAGHESPDDEAPEDSVAARR